jgi:hypothetical protein
MLMNLKCKNCILHYAYLPVAFTANNVSAFEPLYDVDVPFHSSDAEGDSNSDYPPKTGFFRLHGVKQRFISYSQEDWDEMNK